MVGVAVRTHRYVTVVGLMTRSSVDLRAGVDDVSWLRLKKGGARSGFGSAIEGRLERGRMEREARHVLFDDLQQGWSDTTFAAERL